MSQAVSHQTLTTMTRFQSWFIGIYDLKMALIFSSDCLGFHHSVSFHPTHSFVCYQSYTS
jgi:hypothetical protein